MQNMDPSIMQRSTFNTPGKAWAGCITQTEILII